MLRGDKGFPKDLSTNLVNVCLPHDFLRGNLDKVGVDSPAALPSMASWIYAPRREIME
jgi:hypothetical protein